MKSATKSFHRFRLLYLIFVVLSGFTQVGQSQSTSCFHLEIPVIETTLPDTVMLPVRVYGFQNIQSFQLELEYPADALTIPSVLLPNDHLQDLFKTNFNLGVPGKVKLIWIHQSLIGQNLPDGSVLFYLAFDFKNFAPGFIPIGISDNLAYKQEVVQETTGRISVVCIQGGIHVGAPPLSPLQLSNFCTWNAAGCNTPAGAVNYTVSGGVGPYSFSWTGPDGFVANTQNLTGLLPGVYVVTASDQNANTATASVHIITTASTLSYTAQVIPASCGHNDGCIKLTISSGEAPFTFNWSIAGQNGPNPCGLSPGTYTITVTDQFNCSEVNSYVVEASDHLTVLSPASNANCATGQFGTAAALPQNGVSPYQYLWSTAETGPVVIGLPAGSYGVTVTDITGCTGTAEVSVDDAALAAWQLELVPICPGNGFPAGKLWLRTDNPGLLHFPVRLDWSNGTTSVVPAPKGDTLEVQGSLPSGVYTVTLTDSLGCVQTLNTILNCLIDFPADSAIFMWPGDLDSNRAVNQNDLLYLGLAYGATGPQRVNASIDWVGQPAPVWPQSTGFRAVNYRNMDSNGDGLISAADTLGIMHNWGQVINPETDDPFAAPTSVPGVAPTPAPVLSFAPDTLIPGQTIGLPLVLGSAAAPADSLHGLSFSISYDPRIMHPVYFEPLPSWFGDPGNGLLCIQRHFPDQHRLDVALTRTDGVPVDGYGIIGRTFIVIEDDIFFRKFPAEIPDGLSGGGGGDEPTIRTPLFIRHVRAITPANTQPEIGASTTTVVIKQTVGTNEPGNESNFVTLWPNPAAQTLHIGSPAAAILSVCIWDRVGRRVIEIDGDRSADLSIGVADLVPGFYLAEVRTVNGIFVKKFIRL